MHVGYGVRCVLQVGMTELIFVNPGVKMKGQYYCNVSADASSNQTCRKTLFIHKTMCFLRRNWSFFVFCDFPR